MVAYVFYPHPGVGPVEDWQVVTLCLLSAGIARRWGVSMEPEVEEALVVLAFAAMAWCTSQPWSSYDDQADWHRAARLAEFYALRKPKRASPMSELEAMDILTGAGYLPPPDEASRR